MEIGLNETRMDIASVDGRDAILRIVHIPTGATVERPANTLEGLDELRRKMRAFTRFISPAPLNP